MGTSARVAHAGLLRDAREHLRGVRHLRHPLRRDERRDFDRASGRPRSGDRRTRSCAPLERSPARSAARRAGRPRRWSRAPGSVLIDSSSTRFDARLHELARPDSAPRARPRRAGARIGSSIFIASSMSTTSPLRDGRCPVRRARLTTVAGIGALMSLAAASCAARARPLPAGSSARDVPVDEDPSRVRRAGDADTSSASTPSLTTWAPSRSASRRSSSRSATPVRSRLTKGSVTRCLGCLGCLGAWSACRAGVGCPRERPRRRQRRGGTAVVRAALAGARRLRSRESRYRGRRRRSADAAARRAGTGCSSRIPSTTNSRSAAIARASAASRVSRVHDQLGEQRIVVDRHLAAFDDAGSRRGCRDRAARGSAAGGPACGRKPCAGSSA